MFVSRSVGHIELPGGCLCPSRSPHARVDSRLVFVQSPHASVKQPGRNKARNSFGFTTTGGIGNGLTRGQFGRTIERPFPSSSCQFGNLAAFSGRSRSAGSFVNRNHINGLWNMSEGFRCGTHFAIDDSVETNCPGPKSEPNGLARILS